MLMYTFRFAYHQLVLFIIHILFIDFVEPIEEKTEKIKVHANFDYAIMMDAKVNILLSV